MPSLSPLEILVVAVIALIVFGPEKLPQIARNIGRTASDLRRMAAEVRHEFDAGLDLDDDEEEPPRSPPSRTRPERGSGSTDGGATTPPAEETPAPPPTPLDET
jgi:sec-independent protein translocase protein TatB